MRARWLTAAALAAGGCGEPVPPEAAFDPLPLEHAAPVSDLRLDSSGVLLGSLPGEGTADGVHAVSNDTAVVRALLTRAGLAAIPDTTVRLEPARGRVTIGDVVVATPLGYTRGTVRELRIRGGGCDADPIAEMVVQAASGPLAGGPPLIGPVLVSLRTRQERDIEPSGFRDRAPADLTAADIATVRAIAEGLVDSTLALQLPRQWRPLHPPEPSAVQVNVLDDLDGVDVVAFHGRPLGGYAVAVRERRIAATGETVVVTGAFTWAGNRIRPLVAPSAFRLARGALTPLDPDLPAVYARRLAPLAGFGSSVDHLWFELVDVAARSVTWTVIAPETHTVTAAVTVARSCSR